MASYYNVQLRIISGHELPKTDLFSHIDPYVVVSFRGEVVGRTVTRDNNPNPVWQEDFFFEAEEDDSGSGELSGVVTLDLYDEEVGKDEHVGSIVLDLATLGPLEGGLVMDAPVELPVAFKTDRRGQKLAKSARRARLALQVVGVGKGFSAYAAELADVEEARVEEEASAFLLPVPDTEGAVWAGMRFGPRATQLVLVSTQDPKGAPNPALAYDWAFSGAASLRTERMVFRRPVKLLGLRVWSELRALNVPLSANLSKIRIQERPHRLVDTLDPSEVLVEANYMIGMPFLPAVKELSKRGAHIDTAGQSIWLRMDPNQPQPAQLLRLDYSPEAIAAAAAIGASANGANGGGGGSKRDAQKYPALRICSTTSELNQGYELAFFSGGGGGGAGGAGPLVTVSESFRRPVAVLGGMYEIVHTLELRDAFRGDILEEVGLGCYESVRPSRTWKFGKLLEAALAGDGGGGEYEAAAAGGGADGGGAYGKVAGGGGGSVWGLFSCLSLACLAPPRADAYLQEEASGGSGHRNGGKSKKASVRNGAAGGGGGGGRGGGGGGGAAANRGGGGGDSTFERKQTGRQRAPSSDDGEATTGRQPPRSRSKAQRDSGDGGGFGSGGTTPRGGPPAAPRSLKARGRDGGGGIGSSLERSPSNLSGSAGTGPGAGGGGRPGPKRGVSGAASSAAVVKATAAARVGTSASGAAAAAGRRNAASVASSSDRSGAGLAWLQ